MMYNLDQGMSSLDQDMSRRRYPVPVNRKGRVMRFLVIIAILASVTDASATIGLSATCSGDSVLIQLGVVNDYPATATGFVIERREIGTCAAPEIITAAPTPLPAPGNPYVLEDWVEFHLKFPVPFPAVNDLYTARLTDSSGTILELGNVWMHGWDCQPEDSDVASCQDAVIMRGVFIPSSSEYGWVHLIMAPCQDGCWGPLQFIAVPIDDPLATTALTGTVDVYGTRRSFQCFGTGGGPFVITHIEPAPNNACGPVPESTTSFGSLKAMYR